MRDAGRFVVLLRADPPAAGPRPTRPAVRPYRDADRDAVRDICCRTAFFELGATAVTADVDLFADYWTAYYTDHEPESSLVAELDGRVIGYLHGCADTARFRRVMARRIAPPIAGIIAIRAIRGRYRHQPRTRRFLRWLATRAWREEPPVDIARYPAHYHVNLLRDGHGHRLYTGMAIRFLDTLLARGIRGVHGQVLDVPDGGVWDGFLGRYERRHPEVAVRRWQTPSSLGRDVLGIARPLSNHAFATEVAVLRDVLAVAGRRHGI
jgi:hypothetical protein